MKRCFVLCVFVSVFLTPLFAASPPTPTYGNLQLIVEGPFVVCENTDTTPHTVTIAIPQLDDSHYVPTFSGNFDNVPLGLGGEYHSPIDDLESVLTIVRPPATPNPAFTIVEGPGTKMYHESGDCGDFSPAMASFQLLAPIPDEIRAYRPIEEPSRIMDANSQTTVDNCPERCNYGSRLVLHYIGIDLKQIEIDTTCTGSGIPGCIPPDGNKDNDRLKMDPDNAVDSDLEIELSVEPRPENSPSTLQDDSKKAFEQASLLAGMYRQWSYDPPPQSQGQTKGMKSSKQLRQRQGASPSSTGTQHIPFDIITGKECQLVASVVLCSTCN